jgi:hypothetical protein
MMATEETPIAAASAAPQLPNHKVKIKKPGQRACNERNEKGKFCGGHLKRWFYASDALEQECGCVEKAWGPDAEVYRCEFCQTLYLPSPDDARGMNVAGPGQFSRFGFLVQPKKEDASEKKTT